MQAVKIATRSEIPDDRPVAALVYAADAGRRR